MQNILKVYLNIIYSYDLIYNSHLGMNVMKDPNWEMPVISLIYQKGNYNSYLYFIKVWIGH